PAAVRRPKGGAAGRGGKSAKGKKGRRGGGGGGDRGFLGRGQGAPPGPRGGGGGAHRLVVFDTRREAVERLIALGAQAAGSPREVADAVETVMVSLPTPDVVLAVATGPGGVIEGKRVRRFVDLSTTGAVMAKRIFETLK